MKTLYKLFFTLLIVAGFCSCDDYLDKEPSSTIPPEAYFKTESQLEAYTLKSYESVFTLMSKGYYDPKTEVDISDDQIPETAPERYYEGGWRVAQDNANWDFADIYRINAFLSFVMPRYGNDINGTENIITGTLKNIKHLIGEMYALRAVEYFRLYQKFGDFPIITEPLNDNREELIEASKRMPRDSVARFIMSDLDKAASYMQGNDIITTRLNYHSVMLLKSRVALYEGTWLKYFKGSAFVPGGEGWPGKKKDYSADYQFPKGSIEAQSNWFLEQAMNAAKEVGDAYKNELIKNTGYYQDGAYANVTNPYYNMYCTVNLSSIKEVLFWRQFASGVRMHQINAGATDGNWGLGLTRGCVQNFLMNDGTPVYTHIQNDDYGKPLSDTDLYKGDNTLATVVVNRDPRLTLFLKVNGQTNVKGTVKAGIDKTVPAPNFTDATGQKHYVTGYTIRKGGSQDAAQYPDINSGSTGYIMMRSVEALLNYIEASYELRGRLDDTAKEYWKLIRTRNAGMSNDIDKTIETTDMNKEAANDWGAYSGGSLLTDKILYNIRRERRCELLSEGFRYMDLCRWRAMDQLISKPYIPEGIHLWNTPMESLYASGKLITDGSTKANMSPASNSEYVRPFQVRKTQNGYYGYTWKMAHYLEPIGAGELLITSVDGQSLSQSPLYQNPYWPTTANLPAEK